jgi:hypothetical protein
MFCGHAFIQPLTELSLIKKCGESKTLSVPIYLHEPFNNNLGFSQPHN